MTVHVVKKCKSKQEQRDESVSKLLFLFHNCCLAGVKACLVFDLKSVDTITVHFYSCPHFLFLFFQDML